MIIVKHELKQNLKTLILWGGILGGMIFAFMLMFPSMEKQIGEMAESYANMGGFSTAFGLDKLSFATPLGFYGIEAGTMVALGGAMFAAMIGALALSKEEGNHTAEFLLTHPISRLQVVTEKLISVFLQVLLLNIICLGCGVISFAVIGEDLEMKKMLLFHLAQFIMHLEIASICFAFSAFSKRQNVGLGLGFAALLYFINLFVNISEDVEFLKYITPFHYSDAANIISTGKLDGLLIGIGCGIGILSMIIAYLTYCRKNIMA